MTVIAAKVLAVEGLPSVTLLCVTAFWCNRQQQKLNKIHELNSFLEKPLTTKDE